MTRWTLRDPNIYPIRFFDIVEKAHETQSSELLEVVRDFDTARSYLDRFREWRYCLRNSPGNHRCSTIEQDFRISTRTRQSVIGVQIFVTVKPRTGSSIFDLNPELANLSIE